MSARLQELNRHAVNDFSSLKDGDVQGQNMTIFRYLTKADGNPADRSWAVAMAVMGLLILSGCGDDRFPDYRYRMTVEVQTPEGIKSYSSVREVRTREIYSMQSSTGKSVKTDLTGEAIVMDLPGGPTIFALLSRPDDADYARGVAGAALHEPGPWDDETGLDGVAHRLQQIVKVKGPRELPRWRPPTAPEKERQPLWPYFVRFRDIGDPTTIEEVSPQALGRGAFVRRVAIEITDEDVNTGLEKRLAWLPRQHGALVETPRGQSMYEKPAAYRVTEGGFWSGVSQ